MSLVEILVVFVIIAILMGFSLRWLINTLMDYRLRVAVYELQNHVAGVKAGSLTKAHPVGIRMEPNRTCYAIFEDRDRNCRIGSTATGDQDCVYPGTQTAPDCPDPNTDCVRVVRLPSTVKTDSDVSMVFDRKGYPRDALCGLGMSTLRLVNAIDSQRSVIVDRYGRIRTQ